MINKNDMISKRKATYSSEFLDYTILYKEEVDSTNLWAKELAGEGMPEGTVLVADAQTAGKGRRGRTWASGGGHSIYMSILLRPDIPPERASMLTLVAGLSAAQVCRTIKREDIKTFSKEVRCLSESKKGDIEGADSICDAKCPDNSLDARIKWPNDVVVSGKKVCGILTEMAMKEACIDYVVAGIGINVNAAEFPKEICEMATSLALEAGREQDRREIIEAVLKQFSINYQVFLETKDLTGLMDAYNEVLVNRGREIRVLDPKGEYRGTATGINELGELLVRKEDGTCTAVYAGEVSVRGIYGYV